MKNDPSDTKYLHRIADTYKAQIENTEAQGLHGIKRGENIAAKERNAEEKKKNEEYMNGTEGKENNSKVDDGKESDVKDTKGKENGGKGDDVGDEGGWTTVEGKGKGKAKDTGPQGKDKPVSVQDFTDQWAGRAEKAYEHYNKHGEEFPGYSPAEYQKAAIDFGKNSPPGVRIKVDPKDQTRYYYEESTDTFAKKDPNGLPITFFKPGDPTYFDRQPGIEKTNK